MQATGASVCTTATYASQASTQSELYVANMDVWTTAASGLGVKQSCCVQVRGAATGFFGPPTHATHPHDSFLTLLWLHTNTESCIVMRRLTV